MSKIKHCEICGGFGATLKRVIGNDWEGKIEICSACYDSLECFDLDGCTKEEFLESCKKTSMTLGGPKSYAWSEWKNGLRDRTNWGLLNVCNGCHRKMELTQLGYKDEDVDEPDIAFRLTKEMVLPKGVKSGFFLCEDCIRKMILNTVRKISEKDLPLYIGHKIEEFSGEEDEYYSLYFRGLIEKRLRKMPLDELPCVEESPKIIKCLDISIYHLTADDLELLGSDAEEQKDIPNPLMVSAYDHGFVVQLTACYASELESYGYSKNLQKIFNWATGGDGHNPDIKYDMMRFDVTGPVYTDFPLA